MSGGLLGRTHLAVADPGQHDADLATQRDVLLGAVIEAFLERETDPFGGPDVFSDAQLQTARQQLRDQWQRYAARPDTAELQRLAAIGRGDQ